MKKHLALFAVLFALVLLSSSAIAQDATGSTSATAPAATTTAKKSKASGAKKSDGRADKELADLTTKLTLSDDQQAKIKPILTDESEKIHAAKKASTGSADDAKAATKKIRDDAKQQIRALLTPDQQKLFDASSKKGTGEKHGGKKSSAPAAAAPAATN
jgi:Spy/CpxP family protein refolding chaperone